MFHRYFHLSFHKFQVSIFSTKPQYEPGWDVTECNSFSVPQGDAEMLKKLKEWKKTRGSLDPQGVE